MPQYYPTPVPANADGAGLERFLRDETARIARSTDDIYPLYEAWRSLQMGAVLQGVATPRTVGTAQVPIIGYPIERTWRNDLAQLDVDAEQGIITPTLSGIYRINATVLLFQENANQNNNLTLFIQQGAARIRLGIYDVGTSALTNRQLSGSYIVQPVPGVPLRLLLAQSAGSTQCTFEHTNFEVNAVYIDDPLFTEIVRKRV